ncbi:LysR family transcriptional regulator [Arhodomonas sp. AD133]|uniref:LysR family transcriptional regulator n=1 Tax=Arhodomonas sp. AD133 TaxID=3415009 RepID=UPI003EBEFF0C
MSEITLAELRAFDTVVRHQSITAAADRLNVSASAISRRLNALEAHLGVRLLNRSTRALGLTPAGEAYHARIVPALETIAEAASTVQAEAESPRGELRVSLPVNYGRLHVAPHLPDFLDRHPQLSLDAQFDDRFVDVIAEGFDLAIRIGQLEDSRLVARRLAWDRRLVVASPAYLARHGVPTHPRELADHQCLHYTNFRGPVVWTFHRDGSRVDVPVQGRFKANYGLPLTVAAERGLGLVQTAVSIVGNALHNGALAEVLPQWQLPDVAVYAVYPQRRHLPAKVRSFLEFVGPRLPYTDHR